MTSFLKHNVNYNTIVKTLSKNEHLIIDYFSDIVNSCKNDEQFLTNIAIISPNPSHSSQIANNILSKFEFTFTLDTLRCGDVTIDIINNPETFYKKNYKYVLILNADYLSTYKYLNTTAAVIMTVNNKKFNIRGYIIKHIEPDKSFIQTIKLFRCCMEE